MVACLLSRSGDVEKNPGPPECRWRIWGRTFEVQFVFFYASVDLVHDNLKKVCDLLYDARSRWFDLGFQLDIKYTMLEVIKKDHSDVNSCFREMLSTWLKMIDPPPSWECLMTALEHDSVKCGDLAESIRRRFGILNKPENKTAMKRPLPAPAGKPSTSRKFVSSD